MVCLGLKLGVADGRGKQIHWAMAELLLSNNLDQNPYHVKPFSVIQPYPIFYVFVINEYQWLNVKFFLLKIILSLFDRLLNLFTFKNIFGYV